MKFTINTKALLARLTAAVAVCEKKTTIPILAFAKIEAAGDAVTITATNMDVSISAAIPAQVIEPGVLCLPAKRLLNIVQQVDADDIQVRSNGDGAEIIAGSFRSKVPWMNAIEFPAIDTDIDGVPHVIDGAMLRQGLDAVAHAMTKETAQYALLSVQLEVDNAGFRTVATDAYGLAIFESVPPPSTEVEIVPIPGRTVGILQSCIPDGAIEINTNGKRLSFESDGWQLISRLNSGKFPNYQLAIPKAHPHNITLPRQRIVKALERAGLTSDETSKRVLLQLANGALTVSSASMSGEAVDEIAADADASPISQALNGAMLLGGLKHLDTDDVSMIYRENGHMIDFQSKTNKTFSRFIIAGMSDKPIGPAPEKREAKK